MDVWYKAFCCRNINVKTVFQSASEHAIFIQKIENQPPSAPRPPRPSALNLRPPYQNPKHATDNDDDDKHDFAALVMNIDGHEDGSLHVT